MKPKESCIIIACLELPRTHSSDDILSVIPMKEENEREREIEMR